MCDCACAVCAQVYAFFRMFCCNCFMFFLYCNYGLLSAINLMMMMIMMMIADAYADRKWRSERGRGPNGTAKSTCILFAGHTSVSELHDQRVGSGRVKMV